MSFKRNSSNISNDSSSSSSSSSSSGGGDNNIKKTLENLVCPLTKQKLEYDRKNNMLISKSIGVGFRVHDDIIDLLPHNAVILLEKNA